MSENLEITNNYGAESIQTLKGLEAVRMRPGMYVGGTDSRALHHLVNEVLDNSIDEALAGYCTEITTTILENGAMSIKDNGRGIPTGIQKDTGRSALELVMTELHAGGKFDKNDMKFDFNELPNELKHILFKFIQIHTKTMKEESVFNRK